MRVQSHRKRNNSFLRSTVTTMSQHLQSNSSNESADSRKVPAAVRRECPDLPEGNGQAPMWLLCVFGVVTLISGIYLGVYHGGFSGDVYNESESTPDLFSSRRHIQGEVTVVATSVSLAEQGKSIYSNCVPCHQSGGLGLPGQFPTLVGSEWVLGSEKRLISILLKGIVGSLKVGDLTYNGAMPAFEKALSDRKIAAVASYIRATWGNTGSEISEEKVRAMRKEMEKRESPWSEADLLKIPPDARIEVAEASSVKANISLVGVDLDAGKANYGALCAACHQPTGLGLAPVFPPLVSSEYVSGDPMRLVAIVLKGVSGPITVNGQLYTNVMPAQEAVLTDTKISQIASYVRSAFGSGAPPVTQEEVAGVRKVLSGRTAPWSESELKEFSISVSSVGK